MGLVKTWTLDMIKCIAFGSDEAATMIEKNLEVVMQLKKVYHFMTSSHYDAHKTNLAILEVVKTPLCKEMSTDVNALLNVLVGHFKISNKKKAIMHALQAEFNNAQKSLKKFHKIC
jgi:hypothetical protein